MVAIYTLKNDLEYKIKSLKYKKVNDSRNKLTN